MCIIIHKPKGKKLDEEKFRFAWESNDDGAGWCFVRGGKLIIRKGVHDVDDAWKGIKKDIKENGNPQMLIHLRYTTRGATDDENCHPFPIRGHGVAMMHNGTIHKIGVPANSTTGRSDSRIFAEDMLPNFKRGFESDEMHLDMIQAYISAESRVVFMSTKDKVTFVNKTLLSH